MFSLLVSGFNGAWEGDECSMSTDRFKEYSGSEGDSVSITDFHSLKRLEEIPALLMYEEGISGAGRLVRHGKLTGVRVEGQEIKFGFSPHPIAGYLDRGAIRQFSSQLGMHRF